MVFQDKLGMITATKKQASGHLKILFILIALPPLTLCFPQQLPTANLSYMCNVLSACLQQFILFILQWFIEHCAASAAASLPYGMLPKCCITQYGPFSSPSSSIVSRIDLGISRDLNVTWHSKGSGVVLSFIHSWKVSQSSLTFSELGLFVPTPVYSYSIDVTHIRHETKSKVLMTSSLLENVFLGCFF